jgi:small subunit ribosomal protein S14
MGEVWRVPGRFGKKNHTPLKKVIALGSEATRLSAPIFMAKTSWTEKEKRKRIIVAKYAALRAELKAKGDYVGLQKLPRDASPVRLVNRCRASGRRHGYMRRFQLSRIAFRELASNGMIPGVTKSSW